MKKSSREAGQAGALRLPQLEHSRPHLQEARFPVSGLPRVAGLWELWRAGAL